MNALENQVETAQSLEQFLDEAGEKPMAGARFDNESPRTLRIDVDGGIWMKPGAAIAYRGEIAFGRLPTLGGRIARETRSCARRLRWCERRQGPAVLRPSRMPRARPSAGRRDLCRRVAGSARLRGIAHVRARAGRPRRGHRGGRTGGDEAVGSRRDGAGDAWPAAGAERVAPGSRSAPTRTRRSAGRRSSRRPLKTDLSWRSAFGHGGHEPVQMLVRRHGVRHRAAVRGSQPFRGRRQSTQEARLAGGERHRLTDAALAGRTMQRNPTCDVDVSTGSG